MMLVRDKFLIAKETFIEIDRASAQSAKLKRLINDPLVPRTGNRIEPDLVALGKLIRDNGVRYCALCPIETAPNGRLAENAHNTTNPLGNQCGAGGFTIADARSRRWLPRRAPPRGDFRERAKQCKLMAEIIVAATAVLEATMSEDDQ